MMVMTSERLADTSERQRCHATRKDGQPCRAWAQVDGLCIGHSPKAIEARRRGGANSSKKARADKLLPARLRPILQLLEEALVRVYKGELDTRLGGSLSSLAGAIVRLYETGLLEERVTNLESKVVSKSGYKKTG
jgi:DNA-binding transcriptional ArsR family regulator